MSYAFNAVLYPKPKRGLMPHNTPRPADQAPIMHRSGTDSRFYVEVVTQHFIKAPGDDAAMWQHQGHDLAERQ